MGVPLLQVGVGGGEGGWCQFQTCIHMQAHAHMYACTNTYVHTYPYMLIMINMAASMVAAICNFLTCSFWCYMYVHVCICAHCMCACMKTLLCPQILPHPPALPPWS